MSRNGMNVPPWPNRNVSESARGSSPGTSLMTVKLTCPARSPQRT